MPATLEFRDLTTPQQDPGGYYNPDLFQLNNTQVITRANDRNLPPKECSKTQKENNIDAREYLTRVANLQRFFDSSLEVQESGVIRNYNPVLERAAWESLETLEQRHKFRYQYAPTQIEKALRERFHVATSLVTYDIDENGKLRSRDLPTQTFEDVLTVGIEYYKQLGSPDVPRMEQERVGILKIQQIFASSDTPINSSADVVSGLGLVSGTIFTDNFLDRYELSEDPLTGRRIVQMTRFASDLSYEQAEKAITASRPAYFEGKEIPIDEYLLATPLFGNSEILIQRKDALKEEDFQKIVDGSKDSIHCLVDRLCETVFVPEKVAVALNAVLNEADYIWEGLVSVKNKVVNIITRMVDKMMPVFRNIEEKVNWFGHHVVRAVAAGCGLSGGFSIGGISSKIINLVSGVAIRISSIFGGGEVGKKGKTCISCGEVNYCTKTCYKCDGMLI